MSTGRKERYSPEAYASVIKDLADGIPLASALGGPDRPGRTAFYERLKTDPELARDYESAMQQRAESQADALLDVNRRLLEGQIDPQSAKVLSENLKWLSGKNNPKRYGDTTRTEVTARDGAPLIPPPMSDLETARLIAHLLYKGGRAGVDRGDLRAIPMEASSASS